VAIYALVDCNNFYASCERVFNPALEGRPIVVLSNNDGCVIARSNEAKKAGIPMGAPYFQWSKFCQKHNVAVFSSNYALYGDMSNRIMILLKKFCPDMEVYSIDEAFLNFDSLQKIDVYEYSSHIRKQIKMWTGVPVSIGIAPTKTLAKIANHIAKKKTVTGVFSLCDATTREKMLCDFPVADIWGIGRKLSERMNALHIHSAKDLRDSDLKLMRRKFSVVIEKMIQELRGISCLPIEIVKPKKKIMSSRSFGKPVVDLNELSEAVSHYTAKACIKLRNQSGAAQGIFVFLQTNMFKENENQYYNDISTNFVEATSDTRKIIHIANQCLMKIYRTGYRYHKAGIMLLDIIPNHQQQTDLFSTNNENKNTSVMHILDAVNKKIGKGSLFIASEGTKRGWQLRSQKRSPRYTTQWDELVKVFCGN
jgi:DNA polymerase V